VWPLSSVQTQVIDRGYFDTDSEVDWEPFATTSKLLSPWKSFGEAEPIMPVPRIHIANSLATLVSRKAADHKAYLRQTSNAFSNCQLR